MVTGLEVKLEKIETLVKNLSGRGQVLAIKFFVNK